MPQPWPLPRRPHRFSYRRSPFPSVSENRSRRVYETPRLPKPRILLSFIHSSAAARKSNRRIASELFVSVGTVKTHLNNRYRKLGARSRTQAVARARDLKLL
ncbi:MAG TPA: LuxR C-terminal-related transcriptional regulator [Rubrobacter sp.]|nr:LuxR C-terminal-related transcriptional regulator [Rubrobacter sp.]